ncbi:hypothetical protein PoB_007165800 [Plakobranchus ocellatus]|uniref:Peroxin-19 n=1 Tax=Plakobranchus ocellatus TaxID=259542 RepID=A0AAV4DLJ5_9GAST|nr:hypothetical protein PoB_007165800 [Plakobranchus ocellatus]
MASSPGGDGDEEEVVMRRPKNVFEPSERQKEMERNASGGEDRKRVKWSESTELREKLKVYRRSQLDIPLNYQHIALEEAREKEGVKKWRDSLQKGIDLADADDRRPSLNNISLAALGISNNNDDGNGDEKEDNSEDSDSYDEDLERSLLIIKSKSTKFTIQPAYAAAIKVYKDWLASSKNTKELSETNLTSMKSQLKLYQKVVKVYQDWGNQTDDGSDHFDQISSLLQEAADFGPPPQPVATTISEQLAHPDNVKKQVDTYNTMVQEMLNAREEAVKD